LQYTFALTFFPICRAPESPGFLAGVPPKADVSIHTSPTFREAEDDDQDTDVIARRRGTPSSTSPPREFAGATVTIDI
jgi:hypothetical protein